MAKHAIINLPKGDLETIVKQLHTITVKNRDGVEVTMAQAAADAKKWQDENPRRESLQKGDIISLPAGSVARPLQFTDNNGNVTHYIGFEVKVTRNAVDLDEPLPVSFGAFTKRTYASEFSGETIARDDAKFRFGKSFAWHFEPYETEVDGQKVVTQLRVLDEPVNVTLNKSGKARICGGYNNTSKSYAISRESENFAYYEA